MTYYNTTRLRGQQLAIYEAKAEHQEEKVAEFARRNPAVKFSAEDVARLLLKGAPRTSAGRACTNLEQDGVLERLNETVIGQYGRPIYLYRLRPPPGAGPQRDMFSGLHR